MDMLFTIILQDAYKRRATLQRTKRLLLWTWVGSCCIGCVAMQWPHVKDYYFVACDGVVSILIAASYVTVAIAVLRNIRRKAAIAMAKPGCLVENGDQRIELLDTNKVVDGNEQKGEFENEADDGDICIDKITSDEAAGVVQIPVIPVLLEATFLAFNIIPTIFRAVFRSEVVYEITSFVFSTGFLIDPLIFIFATSETRNITKELFERMLCKTKSCCFRCSGKNINPVDKEST